MLVEIVKLSLNTLKYAFSHLMGKLGDLPNQIGETLARDIIWFLKSGPY